MRTINFTTQQFDEALLLKSGGFTYRVDYKWAEIPEKYMEYAISSSCVGPGGELYVTTRIPETPVLVSPRRASCRERSTAGRSNGRTA
jgi:hypothetical protein